MPNGLLHLFIPGPTNVPDAVRRAMNVPQQDHRAPDFPELTVPLFAGLKKVFANETGRVFMYPSSGTGAWEAAISNTLNRGDRVLMSRFGQFSHLWAEMAGRLGLDVICVDREWGEGVPLDDYARHLSEDKTIKGVFACHNETATGVTSDIAGVRRVMDEAGSHALLFVDAVSSLASIPFEQEAWGVDLALMKAGKARALACFGAQRSPAHPDVPTMKELGYDIEFYLWVGLFAPKGTPEPIVATLREVAKQAAAVEQFQQAMKNIGQEVAYLDQPEFKAFWDADAKRVEEAVRQIGKV